MAQLCKTARPTLTAVELDQGDELRFTLQNGQTRSLVVRGAGAWISHTNLPEMERNEAGYVLSKPLKARYGGITHYRIWCVLEIDSVPVTLTRTIGTQQSFCEPFQVMGMRLWLDACLESFGFLNETHGFCRPRKQVRLAVQDAGLRLCPTLLHPWCPLPAGGLRIEECYNGDDCWMGAYQGADAHGGLDINHPAGTPLWTPISFADHYYFDSLAGGQNNNRWRGLHPWADGSTWILQAHHMFRLLVPEHTPLEAGVHYADAAGVLVGDHAHSHFVFKVREPGAAEGEEIALDPWLLFWQMYQDRSAATRG